MLSGGSNCRFETGHSKARNCSGGQLRCGARFPFGANSIFSFGGICSASLAQRQRHTPRNTSASHLEITPRRLPWWTADGTGQRSTKTTFRFSKEKIHEEDQGNGVNGSNRARLCRSGEGGERSMLRIRRLLCLLRRVLEAGS
jgi:hypothetical protein